MSPAIFFSSPESNNKKVKHLCKKEKEVLFDWESCKASSESPGAIENDEVILRALIDPIHYDMSAGCFKPNAFEDVLSHGLSIHRLKYTTPCFVNNFQKTRVEAFNSNPANEGKPRKNYLGYIKFMVSDVRSVFEFLDGGNTGDIDAIMVENSTSDYVNRHLFVFDTANDHDCSHAEICGHYKDKLEQRRIRSILFQLANKNAVCMCN